MGGRPASGKNDGTLTLPLVRLCVQRTPGDCLFTLWNEKPWQPGKKMDWNVTASKHLPDLGFDVSILWMTDPRPSALHSPSQAKNPEPVTRDSIREPAREIRQVPAAMGKKAY
jgi:hypothetical protein